MGLFVIYWYFPLFLCSLSHTHCDTMAVCMSLGPCHLVGIETATGMRLTTAGWHDATHCCEQDLGLHVEVP